MGATRERYRTFCVLSVLTVLSVTVGCGSPPATLELVSVAQKALVDATQYQSDRHVDALQRLDESLAALDAAFDADVRLIEAGKITDLTGEPVELSADWVISARKGYAAARGAVAEQRRRLEAAHTTHLDNLAAALEALDLAKSLIIQHASLTARAKQFVMSLQRRPVHE